MLWEYAIVGIILLGAIWFAVWFLYRSVTGRRKPCDSCPSPTPCPLGETPEEVAERLSEAFHRHDTEAQASS